MFSIFSVLLIGIAMIIYVIIIAIEALSAFANGSYTVMGLYGLFALCVAWWYFKRR